MGSKLTRQRSLDFDSKLSKRRRQRNDMPAESERSGGRDFLFTSLMLKSDKLPGMLRKNNHSPYVRRVAWIREIQRLLREQKMEQAAEVLKLLRKVKDPCDFWQLVLYFHLKLCYWRKIYDLNHAFHCCVLFVSFSSKLPKRFMQDKQYNSSNSLDT